MVSLLVTVGSEQAQYWVVSQWLLMRAPLLVSILSSFIATAPTERNGAHRQDFVNDSYGHVLYCLYIRIGYIYIYILYYICF